MWGIGEGQAKKRGEAIGLAPVLQAARWRGLEPDTEAESELPWRRIGKAVQRLAEVRAVVPIPALDRGRGEGIEGREPGGGVDRGERGRVDARLRRRAAVREDRSAASAQLELVEQIDDLGLGEELQRAHAAHAGNAAAVVDREIGSLLRLGAERVTRRVEVDRVCPRRRVFI